MCYSKERVNIKFHSSQVVIISGFINMKCLGVFLPKHLGMFAHQRVTPQYLLKPIYTHLGRERHYERCLAPKHNAMTLARD